MGEVDKLIGLARELGFTFLPLLRVADLVEFDGDDPVVRRVQRGPDQPLPAESDLFEQSVLQELVARVEIAQSDGLRFRHVANSLWEVFRLA